MTRPRQTAVTIGVFTLLVLLAAPTSLLAAPTVSTIVDRGSTASCIDVVIVAEGYLAADDALFAADAKALADGVFGFGPYAAMSAFVNVHTLFVASKERGADHPSEGAAVQTAFDATFETGGIKRLLTADDAKVMVAVTEAFAEWDLAVLLVNDEAYGGSGGPVPVVSVNGLAIDILRHEVAHAIAGLADEYEDPYPGKPIEDPEPNVALKANLNPLKWQHWVTEGTAIPTPDEAADSAFSPIGAYEGARHQTKGMFRAAPTCMMRDLNATFCPICWESIIVAMAAQIDALESAFPANETVMCGKNACPLLALKVRALTPISVQWRVDGALIEAANQSQWAPAGLSAGNHTVVATARWFNASVRSPANGVEVARRSWQVLAPSAGPGGHGSDGSAVAADVAGDASGAETGKDRSGWQAGCAAKATHDLSGAAATASLLLACGIIRRRRCTTDTRSALRT